METTDLFPDEFFKQFTSNKINYGTFFRFFAKGFFAIIFFNREILRLHKEQTTNLTKYKPHKVQTSQKTNLTKNKPHKKQTLQKTNLTFSPPHPLTASPPHHLTASPFLPQLHVHFFSSTRQKTKQATDKQQHTTPYYFINI